MRIGVLFGLILIAPGAGSCNAPTPPAEPIVCAPADIDQPSLVSPVGGPYCFPSPDGRERVVVDHYEVRLESRPDFDLGRAEGGHIVWRPDSSGFGIFDPGGSGQSSYFRYVDLSGERPVTSTRLTEAIEAEYARWFNCSGEDWWVYQWSGEGWTDDGQIRILAQSSHHSTDCDQPYGLISVTGDPVTGAISRVLSHAELSAERCLTGGESDPWYCRDYGPTPQ